MNTQIVVFESASRVRFYNQKRAINKADVSKFTASADPLPISDENAELRVAIRKKNGRRRAVAMELSLNRFHEQFHKAFLAVVNG